MGWDLVAELSAFVSAVLAQGMVVVTGTAASVLSLLWAAATKRWKHLGSWRFQPWMLGFFGLLLLCWSTFLAWRDERSARNDLASQLELAHAQVAAATGERDRLRSLLDSSVASGPASLAEQIRELLEAKQPDVPPAPDNRRVRLAWVTNAPPGDVPLRLQIRLLPSATLGAYRLVMTDIRPWSQSVAAFVQRPDTHLGTYGFSGREVIANEPLFPENPLSIDVFKRSQTGSVLLVGAVRADKSDMPIPSMGEWRLSFQLHHSGGTEESHLCFAANASGVFPTRCRDGST